MKEIIRRGIATKLVLYLFRNPNYKFNYESKLRRKIDCTYSGLCIKVTELEKKGFLNIISKDGKKYLELTIEGKMIAQYLDKLDRLSK